jgi:hypothetical protein
LFKGKCKDNNPPKNTQWILPFMKSLIFTTS